MTDKLKFGLIGCGSQGRFLSEALRMTDRADLIACADPNAEAAATAISQCGYCRSYTAAAEMLDDADIDAVIIATIHDQLQPMAMEAVNAGKHVFVEKPMALNAADGQALVDAAAAANVRLMVGYTLRFMPERMLMKKMLDEGAIGKIAHISCGQCVGLCGGWLNDPRHGGGPLYYIGSHALDNALWMVHDRHVQTAYAVTHWPDPDAAEASVDAILTVEGGVAIHLCTSYRIGGRYGWLDVMGSEGRMRAEWESNKLFIWSTGSSAYAQPTEIEVPLTPSLQQVPFAAIGSIAAAKYLPMWAAEMHEFVDAIGENREPRITGADGVRFLRVSDAIFESARTRTPVKI